MRWGLIQQNIHNITVQDFHDLAGGEIGEGRTLKSGQVLVNGHLICPLEPCSAETTKPGSLSLYVVRGTERGQQI